jgi:hypothetical protein
MPGQAVQEVTATSRSRSRSRRGEKAMMRETENTNTKAVQTGKRLKKDGTPDRRNGNPGNRGNRHATGKKAINGEKRKTVGYYASKNESDIYKKFIKILHKKPDEATNILHELGTPPPDGTPAPPRKRKSFTCCLLEAERVPAKIALAIIKDRLTASKAVIDNYII